MYAVNSVESYHLNVEQIDVSAHHRSADDTASLTRRLLLQYAHAGRPPTEHCLSVTALPRTTHTQTRIDSDSTPVVWSFVRSETASSAS